MKSGWIKLHRRMLDNPRVTDPEWLAVWVYLLLSATHQPRKLDFDGRMVEWRPGQFITGRLAIATATGVHESKVKRILAMMKSDQQIDQQAGVKGSMFTVRNWSKFQDNDQQNDQQLTSDRPASDQRPPTNKNERPEEGKNGKKKHLLASESFNAFYSAYPRKVKKQAAIEAFASVVEPKAAELLPDILTALKWQTASKDWQRENGQFIPYPASYLNGRRWEDQPTTATTETNHAHGF